MFSTKGWLFLMIAIASASFMNIAMKSLIAYSSYRTYVIAIAVGLVMAVGGFFLFNHSESGIVGFNRWMVVLGISVALLNFAYVWIYQEGGNLALIPLIVTAGLTVVMTIVGVAYFGENISLQQYIGMGIVIAGLAVMMIQ